MITAEGSTIAGNADPMSGGYVEAMTTGYGYTSQPTTAVTQALSPAASPVQGGPKVAYVLIMLIVGLVVLKFLSEHEKADIEVAHVRISVWNWFAITLLAITGIVSAKGLLNLWPGAANPVTAIVNAA